MKLYRNKPIVIEAIQLTKRNIFEVYSFVFDKPDLSNNIASDKWDEYEIIVKRYGMLIPTLEGDMKASIGDYIIKRVKGEYYPCKPDIFEMTYEPIKRKTMTKPNESANSYGFCTANGECVQEVIGLTKREYFSAKAMQGMYANQQLSGFEGIYEQLAKQSVWAADALIEQLNK